MEKIFRSIALIQKFDEDKSHFLLRFNADCSQLNFITGDRLERESFRESVTREVSWQLELDRNKDFIVSNMAQLSMEYTGLLPGMTSECKIAVAFYLVHLYGNSSRTKVNLSESNHWVNAAEICQGQTEQGIPIDPISVHWINRWDILQTWY